jgi:hypothetical protein
VLCSRCDLPSPEERLLMAIYGVVTVPQLEAAARPVTTLDREAER